MKLKKLRKQEAEIRLSSAIAEVAKADALEKELVKELALERGRVM